VGLDASACGPWENTFLVVFELGHCPNSAWDTKSYPAAHGLDWQRPKLSEMLTEGPLMGHNRRSRFPRHTSGLPLISGPAKRSQLLRLGANNRLMHCSKTLSILASP
jgi:hypothetical protein